MRILITGIAGFVGSSLARSLLSSGYHFEIFGVDNLSFGYRERLSDLKDRLIFIESDVSKLKDIELFSDIDFIIHCAAIAPLPECQISASRALDQNVKICGDVVDYALHNGIKNIIFFSSGAVYEGLEIFPSRESSKLEPRLIYPLTKYLSELFFNSICNTYEINVTAIRLFNLYGPHQDYFRKQPPLIGYLLKNLILNDISILHSSGSQKRDYIYIDDLCELVKKIISSMSKLKKNGHFEVVNAGNSEPISVNEILSIIERLSSKNINIKRAPSKNYWNKYPAILNQKIPLNVSYLDREVDKHTHACIDFAKKRYDWVPKFKIEDGLKICLEFAKENIK